MLHDGSGGRGTNVSRNVRQQASPAICPVCGEEVPRDARACPGCGADHETGWNEEATASDGLDLPEETFDYDAFVRREFGNGARRKRPLLLAVAAGLLILGLLAWWLKGP